MIRFWVAFAAILFVGCAATTKQEPAANASAIPQRSWRILQDTLQNAPVDQRHNITEASLARLQNMGQTEPMNKASSQDVHAILFDILTHTSQEALLPDAKFETLHNIVIGDNRHLEQAYAMAMTDYLT